MTKVITGIGSLKQLSTIRAEFNAKTIMLVTGKASYSACGAKNIIDNALQDDKVVQFSDFDVNPKIEDAERGVALAVNADVDLIIGVGGGSVMDMAKLIKAFYCAPEKSKQFAKGELVVNDPGIPLILIPTTAGSGSEATHFAVVYLGAEKYSLAADCLQPDAVILDAKLVTSGTKYLKACNALDAMAQAIESYWATGSTEKSRLYSRKALELGWEVLPKYIQDNCSIEDAQKMIEAANFAGHAINISKTTAAHAWSYALTSKYDIPHGHAVWLTLPSIFEVHKRATNKDIIDERGETHLQRTIDEILNLMGLNRDDNIQEVLCNFLDEIGVQKNMIEMGINDRGERKDLSLKINIERMKNNPVDLTQYISQIFEI